MRLRPARSSSTTRPAASACASIQRVYQGYTIPPYYDCLIGKLIVYGRTRDECLQRLRRAVDEFVVDGMKTTLPLFQRLIRNPTSSPATTTSTGWRSFWRGTRRSTGHRCKPHPEPAISANLILSLSKDEVCGPWFEQRSPRGSDWGGHRESQMSKKPDPFAIELTPELIIRAYQAGIFPMAEDAGSPDLFWVSPEMRELPAARWISCLEEPAQAPAAAWLVDPGRHRFCGGHRGLRHGR